jgi:hypothetical protein
MPWRDLADDINALCFDTVDGFGETFTYQTPTGDPFSIPALRKVRAPDEFNPAGAFEGLEVRESDFIYPPAKGDFVTVDLVDYVVSDVRGGDPLDGCQTLILSRRTALAPTP